MTNKNCSKCGKNYPTTKEYFTTSKNCKLGLSNVCKICTNIQKLKWKKEFGKIYRYVSKAKSPRNLALSKYKDSDILRSARILRQGILKRSKKLNLNCDKFILTVGYFYDYLLNNRCCECCNKTLDFSSKKQTNNLSPTIDRIIPNIGYVTNNIALLCWRCNVIKSDASLERLRNLLNWMKNEM